jgi:hypothetical protein
MTQANTGQSTAAASAAIEEAIHVLRKVFRE